MDILDKLKSQIGDDVQYIFDHEALFKGARDEIAALRARLEAVEKERDDARDNSVADFMKLLDARRRAKRAEATLATARDALRYFRERGCPDCGGDCSSANPPVLGCIMHETAKLLGETI